MSDTPSTDDLAELLISHRSTGAVSDDHPWKTCCSCGSWSYIHENHLAELIGAKLADHDRQVRAEALREAAHRIIEEGPPRNYELNYNGTEDQVRSAFVQGFREAWESVNAMADQGGDDE